MGENSSNTAFFMVGNKEQKTLIEVKKKICPVFLIKDNASEHLFKGRQKLHCVRKESRREYNRRFQNIGTGRLMSLGP